MKFFISTNGGNLRVVVSPIHASLGLGFQMRFIVSVKQAAKCRVKIPRSKLRVVALGLGLVWRCSSSHACLHRECAAASPRGPVVRAISWSGPVLMSLASPTPVSKVTLGFVCPVSIT